MRKVIILLVLSFLSLSITPVFAEGYNFNPTTGIKKLPPTPLGIIYSQPVVPVSATETPKIEKEKLKEGSSRLINIFGLIEIGDAGIYKAAKNGEIKRIHYVDVEPLVIRYGYINFSGLKTTVYGE